jgi:hypothetical protein
MKGLNQWPHIEHGSNLYVPTLSIATDSSVLDSIRTGYKLDPACQKLITSGILGLKEANDLWYVGDCLLVPRVGDVHKNLFHLAHDSLGHFGVDKAYAVLRDCYYWPNMRKDLEEGYIPSCTECQCNKS